MASTSLAETRATMSWQLLHAALCSAHKQCIASVRFVSLLVCNTAPCMLQACCEEICTLLSTTYW